jgi:hypothetical protein
MDDLFARPGVAWCMVGERIVFLDTLADRYFCLPEAENRAAVRHLDRRKLKRWHQPPELPRPNGWERPAQSWSDTQNNGFDLAQVARAIWVQRRIERRIAAKPLFTVLKETRLRLDRCLQDHETLDDRAQRWARAFAQARLLRTAADRCLPRSIALAFCLAATGTRAKLVFGVQLPPFAAHSWVQLGDMVVNDSAEEARRFEPILVI